METIGELLKRILEQFKNRGLTLIRHFAAVAGGAAMAWLAQTFGAEPSPEAAQGAAEFLTFTGDVILLAGYAALEKLLKPVFEWLGEVSS